jgi:hypothetical protein
VRNTTYSQNIDVFSQLPDVATMESVTDESKDNEMTTTETNISVEDLPVIEAATSPETINESIDTVMRFVDFYSRNEN